MPYKMLVSDLDGTFLDNHSLIPAENMEALRVLKEKDIRFVLCSGRSHASLDYFINCISQKSAGNYAICFNGCMVYEADTMKFLSIRLLKNAYMKEIVKHVRAFRRVQVSVYDAEGKLFTDIPTQRIYDYCARSRTQFNLIDDLCDIDGDISKVLLDGRYEDLEDVRLFMSDKTGGQYNMFFSGRHLLEFTDLSANKGDAVLFLAKHLGIEPSDIIAVGDNYNDIAMLNAAGMGIAVANAEEGVKARAGYVTQADNSQGVLPEIISRFLNTANGDTLQEKHNKEGHFLENVNASFKECSQ